MKTVKLWFTEVISNMEKLGDALEYYEEVIQDGESKLIAKGDLGRLLLSQPGLVYWYEKVADDAAKIKKWIEHQYSHEKSKKAIQYRTDTAITSRFGKDIKAGDINNLVESDLEVFDIAEKLLFVEAALRSLNTLVDRLKDRGFSLNTVSKLRMAGLEEIFIDTSTAETDDL